MAGSYDVFGACILLREIFEDDLGHLYRAGIIGEETIERTIWLRVLDGDGIPGAGIIAAFDRARLAGDALAGGQTPADPLFLEVGGVPGLGCDYVAGQPLNRVLERGRDEAFPLQPDNALLIVEKIAAALAAAEEIEISGETLHHGFLHPGLVYLSNDGEALVTGLGIGQALLAAVEEPDSVAGVRAYLAPEVLSTGQPSGSGDVYSIGAILFHLLTGTALPAKPEERMAALAAGHVAWDGETLAPDIRAILDRSLAQDPAARYSTAADFRSDLDRLIYGGAYSPTTFNLALFMDRLFRSEIEQDEMVQESESEIDIGPFLVVEPAPTAPSPAPETEPALTEPEAVPPAEAAGGKRGLWMTLGGVALIAVIALVFWIGREVGSPQPPPTPTAADIAARRQAQEDRLRALTQEMVQEMMATREQEIREELLTRQTRIEELQRRLQRSERRAAQSAAAAATEAQTQEALKREIEEQEEAQREQQDALETERQEAIEQVNETVAAEAAVIGGAAVADADTESPPEVAAQSGPAEPPPAEVIPSPMPEPRTTVKPKLALVKVGDFVAPKDVDTLPVVIKSQPLEWPRIAQRSKGKGVVVVQLTVNATGGVDEVTVLRADHMAWGIPETAAEAAKGYRYKPGTMNGVAITTHAFVTWRYDFTQP